MLQNILNIKDVTKNFHCCWFWRSLWTKAVWPASFGQSLWRWLVHAFIWKVRKQHNVKTRQSFIKKKEKKRKKFEFHDLSDLDNSESDKVAGIKNKFDNFSELAWLVFLLIAAEIIKTVSLQYQNPWSRFNDTYVFSGNRPMRRINLVTMIRLLVDLYHLERRDLDKEKQFRYTDFSSRLISIVQYHILFDLILSYFVSIFPTVCLLHSYWFYL